MSDFREIVDLMLKTAMLCGILWNVGVKVARLAKKCLPGFRRAASPWLANAGRWPPSRLAVRFWRYHVEIYQEIMALREPVRSIFASYLILFLVAMVWDLFAHPADPPQAVTVPVGLGFLILLILAAVAGVKMGVGKVRAQWRQ